MTRLRFKIIKRKDENTSLKSSSFFRYTSQQIYKKIKRILANDSLPLIITPPIFIAFAGLEWWHWYNDMPTPSPILLTVTALGLSSYCLYKFATRKKRTEKHLGTFEAINE